MDAYFENDNVYYEFEASSGFTKGIFRVYGDKYTFTSKKSILTYEYSLIANIRKDKLGNIEVKLKSGGTPLYYSCADRKFLDAYNQTIEFICQRLDPATVDKVIPSSHLTLKDHIGIGRASMNDNDSEFVKHVMHLPGADTWGTKKEIIELERLMQDDENVFAIASGYHEQRTWLFACTDRRILAVNKNFMI